MFITKSRRLFDFSLNLFLLEIVEYLIDVMG